MKRKAPTIADIKRLQGEIDRLLTRIRELEAENIRKDQLIKSLEQRLERTQQELQRAQNRP
jgi:hypothetical protein